MQPLPVVFALLSQCLDAEPLPACRSFIVTEAHVLARVTPNTGSGAGVVLTSVGTGGLTEHAGLTTQVALDLGGWIKLAGGVDWVPGLRYTTDYPPVPVRVSPSVYLGLSLTRTPARLAWAAAGAGGLLAAAWDN